jgi:hypothetical protein
MALTVSFGLFYDLNVEYHHQPFKVLSFDLKTPLVGGVFE